MLLDELGTFLQQAGIGTVGTTLFKGQLPMDAPAVAVQDALVALIETPGLPPVRTHDLARYEMPVIQVASRGVPYGYVTARQKAHDAWMALDGVRNQTLGSGFYLWIEALQSPWWLRSDELNRPVIVFSIRAARAL